MIQLEDEQVEFLLNPCVHMTWSDEDFIGRVSRVSRRCHPVTCATRTIDRCLGLYRRQWISMFGDAYKGEAPGSWLNFLMLNNLKKKGIPSSHLMVLQGLTSFPGKAWSPDLQKSWLPMCNKRIAGCGSERLKRDWIGLDWNVVMWQ